MRCSFTPCAFPNLGTAVPFFLPLELLPPFTAAAHLSSSISMPPKTSRGKGVAKDAGELAAAGVYILSAGMTVDQVSTLWCPYLTMAEGLKIAAQSFRTDVSKLSCCAA